MLEFLLRLAGETHDERGAKGDVWHDRAHPLNKLTRGFMRTPHAAQHVVVCVLKRQIEIPTDLRAIAHLREQPFGESRGIGIHHAQPWEPRYRISNSSQQVGKAFATETKIVSIVSAVLRDQDTLLYTLIHQLPNFTYDQISRLANQTALHRRNRTECATLITPVTDLDVGARPLCLTPGHR